MGERAEFDLSESLKLFLSDPTTILTPEAPSDLTDCENDPSSLTTAVINGALYPVVDAITDNPEAVASSQNFDTLQFLLKNSSLLPAAALGKVLDLVVSGLSAEANTVNADIEADEQESIQHHKQLLEMYGFLLYWAISAVEAKAAEKPASSTTGRGRGGRGAKPKAGSKDDSWDSSAQLTTAMENMCRVMKLKISRIFVTTSERDAFIGLFTRPVYLILENEARVKSATIRKHAFKVLCIAVKHHGHAFGAQTSIIQNLSYFEHLPEPMAEFLHILADQYDYPQLTEEILRELSNKEFNSNDPRGPKSVSTFITKISELVPHLVVKQMTLLAKLLESESYTLRCAIIEVCANLISMLSKQRDEFEDRREHTEGQINTFFEVLEQRFLDINPYCRTRTIQCYIRLCDVETIFPVYRERRQNAAELAARSLEDKSSHVRRNAIKLLAKLVTTHPFHALHGGQLTLDEWTERLQQVQQEIDALMTSGIEAQNQTQIDATVDEGLVDDATQVEAPAPVAPALTDAEKQVLVEKVQALDRLTQTRRYYSDAIKFIELIHASSAVVTQLLSSKNKSEVIEAMDFFTVIDAYKVQTSRSGIRRMLRLIWTKGNSDEGKGVQAHLIDCYKSLFFDAPDTFDTNSAANFVARNMVSLTFGATPAELISLEQLLSTMMKQRAVNDHVIAKLWQIYGVQKKGRETSRTQRRGAIIVLGMLALADPSVIVKEMEICLRVGLGELGRRDLGLARYTCVALRRMNPAAQANKGMETSTAVKMPNDHAVLARLAAAMDMGSESNEWFGFAEQALDAIYALAKHPDTLCTEIIRKKTKEVFAPQQVQRPSTAGSQGSQAASQADGRPPSQGSEKASESDESKQRATLGFSQLLFIVGHVAIKQIVHLELCEQEFKRRKAEKETKAAAEKKTQATPAKRGSKKQAEEEPDDLDMIGATNEDEFTEHLQYIRERELLYSPEALLSSFGPLVSEVCMQNTLYANSTLQAQAALCLAKLMCVSSEYCETNLPLLLTILERSSDPVVRSNLVVGLGDMAVCFNHLIDENTEFLYRRLDDHDVSVKRTCLMTLTFLILAGQVKVKGQLSEMAKCLEDDDKRIADMARMFFSELATKDNAVYNQFVDMFSVLSADDRLGEDSFRKIIKFLAGFIEKEKHSKQLAAKLSARLPRCETERQWNDVAYVLGLLQHKDEEISKLVSEGFKVVHASA
ncbi:condensin [Phyllosticta capitalensis]|uniref:Condensin complex subunit 1 n=1 Tax=Phyllosticta capitalensis TaxID=121624 RepID=A0ABR1YF72_9PEZI